MYALGEMIGVVVVASTRAGPQRGRGAKWYRLRDALHPRLLGSAEEIDALRRGDGSCDGGIRTQP